MSGKAILRRQCKRAMRQLILRFGYSAEDFEIPATKDNEMDVLPGTPIYRYSTDYESSECDCTTALDQYRSVVAVNDIDWVAVMTEDDLRYRYKEMRQFPERFRIGDAAAECAGGGK